MIPATVKIQYENIPIGPVYISGSISVFWQVLGPCSVPKARISSIFNKRFARTSHLISLRFQSSTIHLPYSSRIFLPISPRARVGRLLMSRSKRPVRRRPSPSTASCREIATRRSWRWSDSALIPGVNSHHFHFTKWLIRLIYIYISIAISVVSMVNRWLSISV